MQPRERTLHLGLQEQPLWHRNIPVVRTLCDRSSVSIQTNRECRRILPLWGSKLSGWVWWRSSSQKHFLLSWLWIQSCTAEVPAPFVGEMILQLFLYSLIKWILFHGFQVNSKWQRQTWDLTLKILSPVLRRAVPSLSLQLQPCMFLAGALFYF